MLVAVSVLKLAHLGLRLRQAVKAVRVGRAIFQRFEAGFGLRVVVGRMRPGQALLDAEVAEEPGQRLAGHGAAVVGVDDQLIGLQLEALEAGGQPLLGVIAASPFGDEPADDKAAEQVEHQIQVEDLIAQSAGQVSNVSDPGLI